MLVALPASAGAAGRDTETAYLDEGASLREEHLP